MLLVIYFMQFLCINAVLYVSRPCAHMTQSSWKLGWCTFVSYFWLAKFLQSKHFSSIWHKYAERVKTGNYCTQMITSCCSRTHSRHPVDHVGAQPPLDCLCNYAKEDWGQPKSHHCFNHRNNHSYHSGIRLHVFHIKVVAFLDKKLTFCGKKYCSKFVFFFV